jgi:structural maintenance of chromosome 4
VAISTACGHLDHIVVQTTAGAQRCLEFLRKHNLGRANFIPLDKMKKGAHDRVVETPEGAPRLFDLINPVKPFIAPAIFLAVSDTLVAPDLETATRWAYDYGKRWRVVTLDGKLIEASGTMSGGGNSVRRGGMKLAVRVVLSEAFDESYIFILLRTTCSFIVTEWTIQDGVGR